MNEKIEIAVDLPFPWCDKCEALHIEEMSFYADRDRYCVSRRCGNELVCRAYAKARALYYFGERGRHERRKE